MKKRYDLRITIYFDFKIMYNIKRGGAYDGKNYTNNEIIIGNT